MNNSINKLKEYKQSGQTFCPYLFLHYHLDTDKATKVCCHATSSINGGTIEFDSSIYNNLRKKILNNEPLSFCNRCYEAEEQGFTSLRQRCIDDVVTSNKEDLLVDQIEKIQAGTRIQPYWYDLRISNNCNLSCVMCGPQYSSTWAKQLNEEAAHLLYEPDVNISADTYKIQLAGGEPFMIKKFARMLSEISNTDCQIIVNTNATIVTKPLLDQLKRFKSVSIVVSIDGYSELNDQIRRGSNWKTVVKNIKMFMELGFNVLVNTVLQRDNINHLYQLGIFLESIGIDDWIISPLFTPENLQWKQQKNIIYKKIEKTLELHSVKRNENSSTLLQHILKEQPQ
jgi:sulfatase maturation enzyme AslB (radical SAM superfamily)